MIFRQAAADRSIAQYVESFWMLDDPAPSDEVQRIIPDGRSEIILNMAEPLGCFAGGKWRRQPQCFFEGQITEPLLLRARGPVRILGITLAPAGAAALLGAQMQELTNRATDLRDISNRVFRALDRVRECGSIESAFGAIGGAVQAAAERSRVRDSVIAYAARQIERSSGGIRVEEIARRVGWSVRQLQRRFKESVGISPKLFARMQRFQRVFHLTQGMHADWAATALEAGYYDQAHLIRDFREFAGGPPTALVERELDLTRQFVQGNGVSHFSKTAHAGPK